MPLLVLALGAAIPVSRAQPPAGGVSLIRLGGFEEEVLTAVTPTNAPYDALLTRGVALAQGAAVPMPAGVYLNPADGWPGPGCRFEYVSGRAGDTVHGGRRAVRVESPGGFSAIAVCERLSVVDGMGLEDRLLIVGRPYAFSLRAKGKGRVAVRAYLYGMKNANLQSLTDRLKVEPPEWELRHDGTWELFEGQVTVLCAATQNVLFVIAVQGNVTFDDFMLTEEKR